MVVPQWLKYYMQDSDGQMLETAVHDAEKKTAAEIVVVVVRSSSPYAQTPITLLLLAVIFYILSFEFINFENFLGSLATITTFILLFLALASVLISLAKTDAVKRWMNVRVTELEQVSKRAQIEFYQNCLHETTEQIGVLIYVSLLERSVVVLTDKKIASHFPPETWQNIVDQVVVAVKNKKMGEGLKTAVESVASLLTGPFPIKSDDVNELPNKIVIKE